MVNQKLVPEVNKLPKAYWEKALELISVIGILTSVWVLIGSWSALPDSIPRTILGGEAVAWGGKEVLVALPVAMLVLYTALTAISKHPKAWNTPWEVSPEKVEAHSKIGRSMLVLIKALCVWVFAYLQWAIIQIALEKQETISPWFLPVSLTALAAILGISFYFMYKYR